MSVSLRCTDDDRHTAVESSALEQLLFVRLVIILICKARCRAGRAAAAAAVAVGSVAWLLITSCWLCGATVRAGRPVKNSVCVKPCVF